ncbi:alpha-N-acetylglucosaminidase [Fodinicola feengrottensis]|uniref:Alpha-N-acetylglucosaminidase n=1 Tax=Fodinicola feengrottensis TaxID=435914 RepID=A0ABN2ICS9_9ACTN
MARALQFRLRPMPTPAGTADAFRISGATGAVTLEGTSTVAVVSAFHWWLKYVGRGHISWNGDRLLLPRLLPAPGRPIVKTTQLTDRYAYNFCTFGYTTPYWSWPEWQRELDYLAASGTNRALALVGQEIVWYDTLTDFGLTPEQVLSWIPGPAHAPWQWYGSISAGTRTTAGRTGVTLDYLRRRAQLGRRIADRMRDLGITPVFPGFVGHVPNDTFAAAHPGATVLAQGDYGGQPRPDWLASTDPLYDRLAARFYRCQRESFGATTHFSADLVHEGGTLGDVPLAAAGRAVQRAMTEATPGATWVLQSWQDNPRQELMTAIDRDRTLVVDLDSDDGPRWNRTNAFWGAPWAWGSVGNFGGRLGMFGSLHEPMQTLPAVRSQPPSTRGRLVGTAFMPEGHHHNPVIGDLWSETTWRATPVDPAGWIRDYAVRRYGRDDPRAAAAWNVLLTTAYSFRASGHRSGEGPYESPFAAIPSLEVANASPYGPAEPRYDLERFVPVVVELAAVHPALRGLPTYQYDLLDVTRQFLANRARLLLADIRAAYHCQDRRRLALLSNRFLHYMDLTNDLLGTGEHWLFGRWQQAARSWGRTPDEREILEADARTIVSVWTPQAFGGLHDYGNRDWHGMVADYYKPRWARFFADLARSVGSGRPPSSAPADWQAISQEWTTRTETYPARPRGDTYAMVRRILNDISSEPGQGAVRLLPVEQPVRAGAAVAVTVRFTNHDPVRPRTKVRVSLPAPAGGLVSPLGQTSFGTVEPGESVEASWQVEVPLGGSLSLLPRASYVDRRTTYTTETPAKIPLTKHDAE